MMTLSLALLGPFSVTLDDQPLTNLRSKTARALLIYLACQPEQAHRREHLMTLLWPGLPQGSAQASLRQNIYTLRKAIPELPARNSQSSVAMLLADWQTVQINPAGGYELDLLTFGELMKAGRERWPEAVELYRGDFLADFYLPDSAPFEEWVLAWRADLRRQVLEMLDTLTSLAIEMDDYRSGERYARQQLSIDNLRESAHQQLIELLARSGRRTEALSHYDVLHQLLQDELGIEPSSQVMALHDRILDGELTTTVAHTAVTGTDAPPGDGEALASGRAPEATKPKIATPYRGLFAFREEDAPFFYGREQFTEQLLKAVEVQSMVAVIGPSGSGKSSVVYAGLLAGLSQKEEWQVVAFRPGRDPFRALSELLLPLIEPDINEVDRLVEIDKLAGTLSQGNLPLYRVIDRILEKGATGRRLLLVADQFEEIYTLCPKPEIRHSFLNALLEVVDMQQFRPKPAFTFLLTLRADFVSQALAHRSFADALQDADVMLGPMSRQDLGRAIARPAQKQGVTFEAGLVTRILDDVGDEPGNLPLLEFALTSLWEGMEAGRLTHAAYEAIGGVTGALAGYADEVYARLEEGKQAQARQIFTQVVRPGEGTEDTRRLATREELSEANWSLVQRLATARLLVTGRDSDGMETVEVVHEALISSWEQLQSWIETDREFRAWQERLRLTVSEWQQNDEDNVILLRGAPLAEAERWLADREQELSRPEQAFIQAGLKQRQRTKRRQIYAFAAVVAVAIVMTVLALFANSSAQSATNQDATAQAALATSAANADVAVMAQETAEAEAAISRAQGVAALAPRIPEQTNNETELAALLAVEAVRLNHNSGAQAQELVDDSLREIMGWSYFNNTLSEHTGGVRSVAFSPDGRWLASGGDDTTILLWDLSRPKTEPTVLSGHTDSVSSVAFSPDGGRLASGSHDNTIRLWDLSRPEAEPTVLSGLAGGVLSVAFSPDGGRLAFASGDNTIRLWDLSRPEAEPTVLSRLAGFVWSVAFSPDGQWLAAGCCNTIRLWDLNRPEAEPTVFPRFEGGALSVAFSPDGQRLASRGFGTTIQLWDLSRPEAEPAILSGHVGGVLSVAFSPDGQRLASGNVDTTIRLWDLSQPETEPTLLSGHTGGINSVAFSSDGRRLASGSSDNTVRLWDLSQSEAEPTALSGHTDRVLSVAFSPDGQRLASGSDDTTIRLWDLDRPEAEPTLLSGQAGGVLSVAFSPDGQRLASGCCKAIRLWDLSRPEAEPTLLSGHMDRVLSVTFSPNGGWLASGGDDDTVRLWDLSRPEAEPTVLSGHTGGVSSVAFSPDGQRLASGSGDNTVRLWDLSQPEAEPTLLSGHTDRVLSVAFSPDGQRLASGSHDDTVRLWDLSRPETDPTVLSGHKGGVSSVAFSPDGQRLASGSDDTTIRLWDVSQPETEPTVLSGHTSWVSSVAFSPDGQRLASGSDDDTIRLWPWPTLASLAEAVCQKVNRNLTQTEWDEYIGTDEPYRETCPV